MISGLLQIQSFYIIRVFQMLGELKFLVYNWEHNTKQVWTMEENTLLTMQLWLLLVMYDYGVWLASVLQIHSLLSQLLKMLHIKSSSGPTSINISLVINYFFSKDRRKFIMLSSMIHGCYSDHCRKRFMQSHYLRMNHHRKYFIV